MRCKNQSENKSLLIFLLPINNIKIIQTKGPVSYTHLDVYKRQVVDAKRKDNIYPYKQVAGVGVVFKLIQALSIKLNLEEKEFLKFLDLVAVGTISDIVPLKDENRVIAKLGLKLVEVTKNIGLKTLISVLGFKKIDSTAISFGVAPRINASGRMGVQEKALNLFLTDNYEEAKKITQDVYKRQIYNNLEKMEEYELESAKKIVLKKQSLMEKDEIKAFLNRKGYKQESIKAELGDEI